MCNPNAIDSREPKLPVVYRSCFDSADSGTNGGNIEWIPQGITTVADAQADRFWGNTATHARAGSMCANCYACGSWSATS